MIDGSISIESIMKAVPEKYRSYIWSIIDMECILKKGAISGYIYDYSEKGFGFITSWNILNEVIIPDFSDITSLHIICCSTVHDLQSIAEIRSLDNYSVADFKKYIEFEIMISDDGILERIYAKTESDFKELFSVVGYLPIYIELEKPGDIRRGRAEPLEKY